MADPLDVLDSNPSMAAPPEPAKRDPLETLDLNPSTADTDPNKVAEAHKEAIGKRGAGKPLGEDEWQRDVVPFVKERFPGQDPEALRPAYESQRKLENARQRVEGAEETWGSYLQRKSIPGASRVRNMRLAQSYQGAAERVQNGTATDEDYSTIAAHERSAQIQRTQGTGGDLLDIAAGAPAMLGEMWAGGTVLKTIARSAPALSWLAPEAGAAAPASLLPRLAQATGRTLAQTTVNPSMYLDPAMAKAEREGGQWYEAKNLAPSFAMGALQMSVLGSLGSQVKGGTGAGPWLKTLAARTGVGITEQAGLDLAASTLDDVAKKTIGTSLGLDTGYGLIGDIWRGDQHGLRHLTGQAFMFASFGALHGHDAEPVMQDYATFLGKARQQGFSAEGAAAIGQTVFEKLNKAVEAEPGLTQEQARKLFSGMGELPRQLGSAMAQVLPEKAPEAPAKGPEKPAEPVPGSTKPPESGPPAPEAGTGIINPVQTGVPGIVSGAVELPPEAPKPFAGLPEAEINQIAKTVIGKGAKDAEELVKALKEAGYSDSFIQQLAEGSKAPAKSAQPQKAATYEPTAPPEAPESPQTSAAPPPPEPSGNKEIDAQALKAWAESPQVQQPAATAADFNQPAGPAAPLSRLERMRQAQAGVEGKPVAPPQAPLPPREPTIQEAMTPERRALLAARDQARARNVAEAGKGEIPPGADEPPPRRLPGEAQAEVDRKFLEQRVKRFRVVVQNAIDDPTPANFDHVAEVVSRLASMAEGRGLDPKQLIEKELPELTKFIGEANTEELLSWAKEHRNERLQSAADLERGGYEPTSVRRRIQQRLQDALTGPEAVPPAEGAEAAGPEQAAGSAEGAPAAAVSPSAAASGGEAGGRKLTKRQQAAADRKAAREGEHERFGISKEEWDSIPPLRQQEWRATKKGWAIDEKVLALRGGRSIYADIRSRGGLNPDNVIEELGKGEYEALRYESGLPDNLWNKQSKLRLSDLADEYSRNGAISDWAKDVHGLPTESGAAQVVAQMKRHFLIEDVKKADAAHADAYTEYLNAKANDYREEIRHDNPGYTTQQVEAEVSRRMGAAPEGEGATEEGARGLQEGPPAGGGEEGEPFAFGHNAPESVTPQKSRILDLADRWDKEADAELKKLSGGATLFSIGDIPRLVGPLAKKIAAKIIKGGYTFAEFAKEAVQKLGDDVKPFIKEIWDRASAFAKSQAEEDPFAAKFSVVDADRAERGLPPIESKIRRGREAVWDEAKARLKADKDLGQKTVESYADKPRAFENEVDHAIVVHERMTVANEHEKAVLAYLDAPPEEQKAAGLRESELAAKLNRIDEVARRGASGAGTVLQAQKMAVKDDFTLSKMLLEAQAAKGRPLTLDEKRSLAEAQKKIEQLQGHIDKIQSGGILPPEDVLAALQRAKDEFRVGLEGDRYARKPFIERMQDTFSKWVRTSVLSSPVTIGKLFTAAVERLVTTPLEETVGAAVATAFPELAKRAKFQGDASDRAEARAFTSVFTQGMRDAWDTITTGKSNLDVLYGEKEKLPRSWLDWMGSLHGALKAPVKRAAFERAMQKGSEWAAANGMDPTDPFVQLRLGTEAYKEAQKSIFMQDNRVVDAYNKALSYLEAPDRTTGKVSPGGKLLATLAKSALPVVKVPSNIVAETFQHIFGLATGGYGVIKAYAGGIEKLKPAEADLIMQQLKKGSLGGAALVVGFLGAGNVGGYYQHGEKRKESEVKAGGIKIYGQEIPSWAVHNPLLEAIQVGATARHAMDSKMHKGDTERPGFVEGAAKATLGLVEEVPFVREAVEVGKALDKPAEALGKEAKTIAVPQAVQFAAKKTDTLPSGTTVPRKVHGFYQEVEEGIPGLRQTLPRK